MKQTIRTFKIYQNKIEKFKNAKKLNFYSKNIDIRCFTKILISILFKVKERKVTFQSF